LLPNKLLCSLLPVSNRDVRGHRKNQLVSDPVAVRDNLCLKRDRFHAFRTQRKRNGLVRRDET
jgi:hypothetical protein